MELYHCNRLIVEIFGEFSKNKDSLLGLKLGLGVGAGIWLILFLLQGRVKTLPYNDVLFVRRPNDHFLHRLRSIIHPNLHKIKGGILKFSTFQEKIPALSYFSQKEVAIFVEMVYNRPTGYTP